MSKVKILSLISYIIPYYGNIHNHPYGVLLVTDGYVKRKVKIRTDSTGTYFKFKRRKYYITNDGDLYSPVFEIVE